MIVRSFKAVKLSIRCAEARRRRQRGKVSARRFLDRGRQRARSERIHESSRAFLERWQIRSRVCNRLPCIFESRGIVVADDGLALARGSFPSAPLRRSIGKVPPKQKSEGGGS